MNKLLSFLLLGGPLSVASFGQTFLVDLNNLADSNGYPGGSGAWNQYAEPINVNGSAIADSTGSTGLGLNVLEKDGSASTANGWDTNDTQSQTFNAVTDGNNSARYMNEEGINIGASSTLDVRVSDPVASTWSGISALRLSLVPEPGTYAALFALAVGGVVYVRRRR